MSFPDETLYCRNDDDMEDYGDIGAYDDSVEEEYEEEEEEEMGEPAALTPRGGAMSSVPHHGAVAPSIGKPMGSAARGAVLKKKAGKKAAKKKSKKAAKKRGKKKASKKKKGGRKRR